MIPDSGRSYMSKFYDDNWMLEHGFVERAGALPTVDELLRAKHGGEVPELVTISAHQKVGEGDRHDAALRDLAAAGRARRRVRVARRRDRLAAGPRPARARLHEPDALHEDVAAAMQPPLAAVEASATLDEVFATLTGGTNAVVVAREGKPVGVLTRSDLLEFLAHRQLTRELRSAHGRRPPRIAAPRRVSRRRRSCASRTAPAAATTSR